MSNAAITPPRPKGPHLNALRAFEAAARLGNFIAAANELNVTPGAVSQHIKSLEAWVGVALFVRNHRGITLTPLGADLLPKFVEAFDRLGDAVQALRAQARPDVLRITALPSIAQLWLSERLRKLRAAVPDLRVSVFALDTVPNLQREPYDIALYFGEPSPGADEIAIQRDSIFPVCAPEIAAQIRTPSDTQTIPLLKDAAWHRDWDIWRSARAEPPAIPLAGPTYSLFSIALQEAMNGAGLLMAHAALVERPLAEGKLVAPFEDLLELDQHLVMKLAPRTAQNPNFDNISSALIG